MGSPGPTRQSVKADKWPFTDGAGPALTQLRQRNRTVISSTKCAPPLILQVARQSKVWRTKFRKWAIIAAIETLFEPSFLGGLVDLESAANLTVWVRHSFRHWIGGPVRNSPCPPWHPCPALVPGSRIGTRLPESAAVRCPTPRPAARTLLPPGLARAGSAHFCQANRFELRLSVIRTVVVAKFYPAPADVTRATVHRILRLLGRFGVAGGCLSHR